MLFLSLKKCRGNVVADTCAVTALQEGKKLLHILRERPGTVTFQWVEGEKPLHCRGVLYEYGFGNCFACVWFSFSFKSQSQHFNHNAAWQEQQRAGEQGV